MTDTEDNNLDKFWTIIPLDDKDRRYWTRKEAQNALLSYGEGGYILKSIASVSKPVITEIR